MENCIFCKIIDNKAPASKVYETEKVVAFLDSNPVSKGHTLVVPKEHKENIFEADESDYMWDAIVKVSNAIKEAFEPEGLNINQNNGEKAGQEVFHLHFHLTPRYTGDEIEISYQRQKLTEGAHIAESISEHI